MKTLLTLLASALALTAQAQTTFEQFTAKDEWPTLGQPPTPNIIFPGEFFCTGGGEPVISPSGVPTFLCAGGKGIHLRDTEMISFIGDSSPYDSRLEGLAWYDIAANWDSEYTGPVMGNWRIEPVAFPDLNTYWEGTYTGKRELVPDPGLPPGLLKWVTTLKLEGYGVGDLAGMQIKATEVITTYGDAFNRLPVPWELLPAELRALIGGAGPEGQVDITIITED